jgi:TRAP transporter 4TM/12TM fusion protein
MRSLSGFWHWIGVIISVLTLALILNQIFHLELFGIKFLDTSYYYLLLALYTSYVFVLFPFSKGTTYSKRYFFWIDIFLGLLTLGIGLMFALKGYDIICEGWMAKSPKFFTPLGILLWILVLEALRRTQGKVLLIIVGLFSVVPIFAEHLPGILHGIGFSLTETSNYHAFSTESILGIPIQVFADLLVGYMIFGIVLMQTGGSHFFMNFSSALLGQSRGGPAKVSVIASALFGTMSGSAVSNVIATGSVTIPTMKKVGYPPHFAAAVEACASSGGVLMPPVMGATAFVMAMFLSKPYLSIVIAAIVPSFLYYLGLLVQIDGYAARVGLKGLSREELPSLKKTLKDGWYLLFSLVILVGFLVYRLEAQAPFFASAFLLLTANIRKETRLNIERLKEIFFANVRMLSEMVALFGAIGLIIGSLSMTGIAHALSGEIIHLAHGNQSLLLILGACTSFILGMGMTITACYVFLAITLAPALVETGLNPLAVHLFVMYCGVLSYITPPVCVAVYPAASIAGANVMKSGYRAVGLGAVKYIIPFFFVLNPALILQGGIGNIIWAVTTAIIGVILLGSAIEGYLIGVGNLDLGGKVKKLKSFFLRAGIFASGLLFIDPARRTDLIGLLLAAFLIIPTIIVRWRAKVEDQRKMKG